MFALQGTQIYSNISVCRCFPLLHWICVVCASHGSFPKAEHINTHTQKHEIAADEIWNGTLCLCLCASVFQWRVVHSYIRTSSYIRIEWKWSRMKKGASKNRMKKKIEGLLCYCCVLCYEMNVKWKSVVRRFCGSVSDTRADTLSCSLHIHI